MAIGDRVSQTLIHILVAIQHSILKLKRIFIMWHGLRQPVGCASMPETKKNPPY